MTAIGGLQAPELVLIAFVVFSRVGACLMLAPGLSSPRVPVQVRLLVAAALSLALTPLLFDALHGRVRADAPLDLFKVMGSELLVGAMIGMLARLYFVALETIAMAVAMAVGLTANLGVPIEGDETGPALSTLLTLAATALLFLTDQHLVLFRGLAASYDAMPVSGGFSPQWALVQLVGAAGQSFTVALRVGSPFLIFSLVVNVALGLANRLVPGLHTFFLAQPFLLVGGLTLLALTIRPLLELFMTVFSHFLATG